MVSPELRQKDWNDILLKGTVPGWQRRLLPPLDQNFMFIRSIAQARDCRRDRTNRGHNVATLSRTTLGIAMQCLERQTRTWIEAFLYRLDVPDKLVSGGNKM